MTIPTTLDALIAYYDELTPAIYAPGKYPAGFELRPVDWAFTDQFLARPSVTATVNGTTKQIRPLLHMDVEFLSNEIVNRAQRGELNLAKNYPCGLKCPGCFSQEDVYGDKDHLMTWQQVMAKIDEARAIGLHSVKFLGPGELFQNPDLFDILDASKARNMPIGIFTKGAELGDDTLAAKSFGHIGIRTAKELAIRVAEYDGVRLYLGFNSFFADRQDKAVGSRNRTTNYDLVDGVFTNRGISEYTTKRNQALVNVTEAGFTNPEQGQRLCLIATPIQLDQIDEAPHMYSWAAARNIPMIIAPTMESGPKSIGLKQFNERIDPQHQKLVDMMAAIYQRSFDEGILTLDLVREQGVSAYIGTAPCNQVANGLFMRLNGQIQLCPGRSDSSAIYGNVHDTPIADLWVTSPNYQYGAIQNNWCAAKHDGMPSWIQTKVLETLEAQNR